jgi:very-short-patch-repair endonuclease
MTQRYNKSTEKEKRRRLRQNQTKAEALLWQKLRDRQIEGLKFRRQYSVECFVLDFYCPALRLAIEIDGESHQSEEAAAYDRDRQAFIEALGIRFLRFTNQEVYEHLDAAIEQITHTAQGLRR